MPRDSRSVREYELCGVNPILEALRAGRRRIEEIVIAEGARHERFREIVELAGAMKKLQRAGAQIFDEFCSLTL